MREEGAMQAIVHQFARHKVAEFSPLVRGTKGGGGEDWVKRSDRETERGEHGGYKNCSSI